MWPTTTYNHQTQSESRQKGFTLLEVLLALILIGILLAMGLGTTLQLQNESETLQNRLELQYSLFNGGQTLVKAMSSAQQIEWQSGTQTLKILPWPTDSSIILQEKDKDLFYIADKDRNGVTDLYREHLKAPNPIASRITRLECEEVSPGLWRLKLTAQWGRETLTWETLVYQRTT